jgi:hypothetical protein
MPDCVADKSEEHQADNARAGELPAGHPTTSAGLRNPRGYWPASCYAGGHPILTVPPPGTIWRKGGRPFLAVPIQLTVWRYLTLLLHDPLPVQIRSFRAGAGLLCVKQASSS